LRVWAVIDLGVKSRGLVWSLWRFGACGDLGRVAVWGVWPFGACGGLGRVVIWDVWRFGACGRLGCITYMREMRNGYKIFIGMAEGRRLI